MVLNSRPDVNNEGPWRSVISMWHRGMRVFLQFESR